MTPSTSFSSRLSSFSTVSLALSISSFSLGSDGEGYNSSTFQSSMEKKKLSRRKRINKNSSNDAFASSRVDQYFEGNHTLSDSKDDDDSEPSSTEMGRPSHVPLQKPRHQTELGQQHPKDFSSCRMNDLLSSSNLLESRHLASTFVVEEEEDDEDSDWDAQSVHSDSEAPSSPCTLLEQANRPHTRLSQFRCRRLPRVISRSHQVLIWGAAHRGTSLARNSSASFLRDKKNRNDLRWKIAGSFGSSTLRGTGTC
ncbi:MAG: hypothetical protein J3Q66DRAFT_374796 [Benniella sp.]|nr:MAG: hypothetical protein J3Q66DRAFT_374796 [Benniella sp.]